MKLVHEVVELRVRGKVVDRGLVVRRLAGPVGARIEEIRWQPGGLMSRMLGKTRDRRPPP